MPRYAVIGDVGGHVDVLRDELQRLGVDPDSGRLPTGLTVVQVGDLIHRGPDSEGVVHLVDRFLRNDPERWVQLIGNHEAQYVHQRAFEWHERLASDTADMLREWWSQGLMKAAYAFDGGGQHYLITHAGLTAGFWRTMLKSPRKADAAADALNALIGKRRSPLFEAGLTLGQAKPHPNAGPLWASAPHELVPGWLHAQPLPFSQIHGHTSVFDWHLREFRCPDDVRHCTTVNSFAKHETSRLRGGVIIGVDPGHGRSPVPPWRAFEVEHH